MTGKLKKQSCEPMRYEFFISLRQIRARRFQTILSVGAIALAVMILTVSQALMVGFTGELYDTTVNKLSHVLVSPRKVKTISIFTGPWQAIYLRSKVFLRFLPFLLEKLPSGSRQIHSTPS